MFTNIHDPQQNKILQALPPVDYERIYSNLKLTPMPLGKVLYEQGGKLCYIYFPTDCIISLLSFMENGASVETAVIGNEGAVGVSLLMGDKTMQNRAVVRSAGYAYRIRENLLMEEFDRHGMLLHTLLRYIQSLINQTAQMAVCNRFHTIDQKLCRWLLMNLDRLSSNELKITQSLISDMLGVRREGITEALGKLQKAGIIQQSRGHIIILDRDKLSGRVCECYHVFNGEYYRLAAA